MFYYSPPIHFSSSSIHFISENHYSMEEIISHIPDVSSYNLYTKESLPLLFPQVGKINPQKQTEKKLLFLFYDKEIEPYLEHIFQSSYRFNLLCVLVTQPSDNLSVVTRVNTDYIMLDGLSSCAINKNIYQQYELEHHMKWQDFEENTQNKEFFMVSMHNIVYG